MIHAVCAIVFILFLAVMSFLFAASEVLGKSERRTIPGRARPGMFRRPALFWIHFNLTAPNRPSSPAPPGSLVTADAALTRK